MMKVALTNFFFANNYGAVLQCTALKKCLENLGCDVQVIDYRPFYQMQYYLERPSVFKAMYVAWEKSNDPFLYRIKRSVRWGGHTVLSYKEAEKRRKVSAVFSAYTESVFKLTCRYNNYDELVKNPPLGFDAYIAGSDQLWNPDVTWGIDPAYYLKFGADNVTRIVYAVSPCGLDCDKYGNTISKVAKRLDYISLRESEKKAQLERLLGRDDIEVCPDPTLLLAERDYEEYEESIQSQDKEYILVYGFSDVENTLQVVASQASSQTGLPIIDISLDDLKWNGVVISRKLATPGQFLSYIKNAKFVITNSFHGTAFSIIYHKNFFTIEKKGTASRMVELLGELGLSDRIIRRNLGCYNLFEQINYAFVDDKRRSMSILGQNFLRRALK